MRRNVHKLLAGVVLALGLYSINEAQERLFPMPVPQLAPRLSSVPPQTGSALINAGEVFNIRTLGARGDGRTDDTAAIRAAMQTIGKAGGGKLFFPSGVYLVSGPIDLPSSITIEGTNGTYNGNCQIRLTVPGQTIFTIGENRRRITIREIELKAAPASISPYRIMKGTMAIAAEGRYPTASFEFEFRNMTITGFERGLSVEGSNGRGEWEFDNVTIDHVTFAENKFGIYVDSANASYFRISNCWFGVGTDGTGIYLKKAGWFTIDTCHAGGPPLELNRGLPSANSFLYIGGSHATITIINTEVEGLKHFMFVDEPHNYTYPITVINSIVGPVRIRANCIYVSIGNLYHANTVETVDLANDVLIHSMGDVAESPPNSQQHPKGATPFKLQGNSRVVFGSGIHRVDFGNDTTFARRVGIGGDPSPDSLLNLITPVDNMIQLRVGSTQGHFYDMFRDTSGYLNFRGNQRGYVGYRFNGDIVPAANRTGNLGTTDNRWNSINAVRVVSGDAILADHETGEELYRIREDKNNIYFDDIRTGKQLMRLDREGNLHVRGKIKENSQ